MGLVENVKAQARKRNLTIRELEELAGLPKNSIYKWNANDPGIRKVEKAAAILNVTVDELIR